MNTTKNIHHLFFILAIILTTILPAHASSRPDSAAPWPSQLSDKEKQDAALQAMRGAISSRSIGNNQPQPPHPSRAELTPPQNTLLRSQLKGPSGSIIVPFHNERGRLLQPELQRAIAQFIGDVQHVKIDQGYEAKEARWRVTSHLCLSPDGQMLVTAGRDTAVNAARQAIYRPFFKVWRLVNGEVQEPYSQKIFTPDPEQGTAREMSWSPNSQLFVCSYVGDNNFIAGPAGGGTPQFDLFVNQGNKLLIPQTISLQRTEKRMSELMSFNWHPTSKIVAARDIHGSLALQAFDQNNRSENVTQLSESVSASAFNPNGLTLVTSHFKEAYHYMLKVWAVDQTGKPSSTQPLQTISVGSPNAIAFNPSGTLLVIPQESYSEQNSSSWYTLNIYKVDKSGSIETTSMDSVSRPMEYIRKAFWSPCGKKIATLASFQVSLWSLNNGTLLPSPDACFKDAADCAFSSQGHLMTLSAGSTLTTPVNYNKVLVKSAQVTAAVIKRREHLEAVQKENAEEPLRERQRAWRRIKTHEDIEFREDQVNTK
jgi:hypothetical protein